MRKGWECVNKYHKDGCGGIPWLEQVAETVHTGSKERGSGTDGFTCSLVGDVTCGREQAGKCCS